MPAVGFERYREMLDKAAAEKYALPAINVLEVATLNAAIEGFAAAESDGIIQITVAAGLHTSGALGDPVLGAVTLAEHAHRLAERYDVNVAVHSDHCPTAKIDSFLKPLIAETVRRRVAGRPNLFNSHMYDGSDLTMAENLERAVPLLEMCRDNDLILEVEAGVVGGEEDGLNREGAPSEKLYTTPEDMVRTLRPGAVIVDVCIDQGGCVETSEPTTHHDPVRIKHGVVHYAVTNMPGAVGRTSTYALTHATLPYLLELADKGYERACADNPAIRAGLNMALGKLTNRAVADTFGLPCHGDAGAADC